MRALVVAALLLSTTAVAHADDRRDQAKQHFKTGKVAHDAGRYDEAIAEYQAAYELAPLPELLFNLGQVHRLNGDLEQALDYYSKYLAVAPKGPVAGQARSWKSKVEKELASRPAPVPEVLPEPEPEPDPDLDRGSTEEPVTTAPVVTAGARDEPARPGRTRRIAGLASIGVGALFGGISLTLGLDARAASDDVSNIADGSWDQADIDRVAEGESAERWSIVTAGLSAVAIGAGAYLYVTGRRLERATVALVPRADGGVLAVAGSF